MWSLTYHYEDLDVTQSQIGGHQQILSRDVTEDDILKCAAVTAPLGVICISGNGGSKRPLMRGDNCGSGS
jgi:hypothetical protein